MCFTFEQLFYRKKKQPHWLTLSLINKADGVCHLGDSLNEWLPLTKRLLVRGGWISVMDGVFEYFSLQDRQQRGNALWICEVEGIVICHQIEQSLIKILPVKSAHRCGSNSYHAVAFRDKQNWTSQGSLTQVAFRVFWSLHDRKKEY